MRLRLIRLLAVVIALVVPLQGMAVVVAGQCMAFGHHEAADGHDSDGQASDQDGHDHASHSHADDGKVAADAGDANGSHCGPCTACCASASIAGSAQLWIPSSPSNAPYIFTQFPPLGVQPDGLDRPPLAL